MTSTNKRIYLDGQIVSQRYIKVFPKMPRQFTYMDFDADGTELLDTGAKTAAGSTTTITKQPDAPRTLKLAETYNYAISAIRTATAWVASTAYAVGDEVEPTTANGFVYVCTTAGTSDSAEPTWSTTWGTNITDGTVVWTTHGRWFGTAGDEHTDFSSGDTIIVNGSTGNDGTYTVKDSTYDATSTKTRVEVAEAVTSTVADGAFGAEALNENLVVTISGYDQYGDMVSETLTMTATGLSAPITGSQAFAYITSVAYDRAIVSGVAIQDGSGVGIPVNIRSDSDVKMVYVNKVPKLPSTLTISHYYDTISTGSTIAANEDWVVYVEA